MPISQLAHERKHMQQKKDRINDERRVKSKITGTIADFSEKHEHKDQI